MTTAVTSGSGSDTTQITDPAQRFIGLEYDQVSVGEEFPAGVKHYGGGLLGLVEPESDYLYEHVEQEGHHLLWLERFVRKPDGGRPGTVRVLDAHAFGEFPSGYGLQVGGCWKDDGRLPSVDEPRPEQQPGLAVVVRYMPARAQFSNDVTKAVILNWQEQRIDEIPTRGWLCESEGSGD